MVHKNNSSKIVNCQFEVTTPERRLELNEFNGFD